MTIGLVLFIIVNYITHAIKISNSKSNQQMFLRRDNIIFFMEMYYNVLLYYIRKSHLFL